MWTSSLGSSQRWVAYPRQDVSFGTDKKFGKQSVEQVLSLGLSIESSFIFTKNFLFSEKAKNLSCMRSRSVIRQLGLRAWTTCQNQGACAHGSQNYEDVGQIRSKGRRNGWKVVCVFVINMSGSNSKRVEVSQHFERCEVSEQLLTGSNI